MRNRRPREDDADARAEESNTIAEKMGLVAVLHTPQNWDGDAATGTPVDPKEPDYRGRPRPESEVERLPFRNLKGG